MCPTAGPLGNPWAWASKLPLKWRNSVTKAPKTQHPPIYRLPTELLLYIFHYDNPGVIHRLRLTYVSQRWREIAIASGSLWTSVDIRPQTMTAKKFDNFISLLDLQLVRTQNLPLDVVWFVQGNRDQNTTIIKHINQNGPFHRWRSLTFRAHSICPFHSPDGFPNLETLTILRSLTDIILTINRTTTSKLRILDISSSGIHDQNVDYFCGAMLHHITRLLLPSTNVESEIVQLPPFPPNIIDIEAERRSTHPFPYVKTYKLTHGIFREDHVIDLKHLTTLIITSSISVHQSCQLRLPSLRRLVCAAINLHYKAILDAPRLEALEFRNDVDSIPDMTPSWFTYFTDLLSHPGYLLSPTKSLLLDLSLAPELILTMLTQYSHLEKVTLRFNADVTVWNVTAALSSGDTRRTGIICPQLTELRFRIAWGYRDFHGVEWWRDQATRIVRGRKDLSADLHVYGAWDEGETFALLA